MMDYNTNVGFVCRTTPLLDEKQDERSARRDEKSAKQNQLLMTKAHDHVAAERKVRTSLSVGVSI